MLSLTRWGRRSLPLTLNPEHKNQLVPPNRKFVLPGPGKFQDRTWLPQLRPNQRHIYPLLQDYKKFDLQGPGRSLLHMVWLPGRQLYLQSFPLGPAGSSSRRNNRRDR